MRYNPFKNRPRAGGLPSSIVNLASGTSYEVQLTLSGSSVTETLIAKTWSDEFPAGQTIRVADRDTPLAVNESGKPDAYRVYDGRGATINVGHRHDACITIDASYVIIRGLTLKAPGRPRTPPGKRSVPSVSRVATTSSSRLRHLRLGPAQSQTGFGFDYEAAILSHSTNLERLIVQRCKLHHPHCKGSAWDAKFRNHTQGPQCISLFNTAGNHVIRYNECFSDLEHMYNDVIGGGATAASADRPAPIRISTGTSSATAGTTAWKWRGSRKCGCGKTTSRRP